ncbi:hypothetical protein ONA91_11625 [Micromonospora sp. DR5-3]|uniref:hypothetical protein n=1 Tax=unclassified Micromonospora TaxID=2617518 RepID=UPI0016525066|nr:MULTISPECIES: hypothetical protein [unclassified Micromonospora]MCW3815104.1 hypothetical protein [Micromonospora sp. DR5-3]
MAERFAVDPDGVRRLARELAAVRSDADADATRQGLDGPLSAGSAAVEEAVRAFASAATKAHAELYGSVDRLARWLDEVAAGQFSIDRMLGDHVSPGHLNPRSDR